jgi:hypothetical protein
MAISPEMYTHNSSLSPTADKRISVAPPPSPTIFHGVFYDKISKKKRGGRSVMNSPTWVNKSGQINKL